MKDRNKIQLSDLLSLGGLEKPEEGSLTVELGADSGNSQNIVNLSNKMSDFAGMIENSKNIQASNLTGLVEAMKNAVKKELSPEASAKLLKILKRRFVNKKNMVRLHPGMEWKKVQIKLEANPEKLWSLNEMERTGGNPDVVGFDDKTGQYIFMDCSKKSPKDRIGCVYDKEAEDELKEISFFTPEGNAISMAKSMGVDILNEKQYRELQTKGEFDKDSGSFLKTPINIRESEEVLMGRLEDNIVMVKRVGCDEFFNNVAWRGVLRV